jgi:hypothetical protein
VRPIVKGSRLRKLAVALGVLLVPGGIPLWVGYTVLSTWWASRPRHCLTRDWCQFYVVETCSAPEGDWVAVRCGRCGREEEW